MDPSSIPTRRAFAIRTAVAAGIFAILMGCAGLLAWLVDIPFLKSLDPAWVTMKPNAALSLVLSGAALWLLCPGGSNARGCETTGRLLASVVAVLSLLTVTAYLAGLEIGIDEVLFEDPATPEVMHPGRPAPITACLFLLIGIALFLVPTRWATRLVACWRAS